uniref:Pancreatic trypsin inhibitor n=1 Tax=Rhipicephalus zambeziensis TaxID=60191 RepID=A0A224YBR7_9ACAR
MCRISIIMAFLVVVCVASALGWAQQTENNPNGQSLNRKPRIKPKRNVTATNQKKKEKYLCYEQPRRRNCRALFTRWYYTGGNHCMEVTGCVYGGFTDPYKCRKICARLHRKQQGTKPRPKEKRNTN